MGTRWPTIGRPNCRTIDRLISFGDTRLYTYIVVGMHTAVTVYRSPRRFAIICILRRVILLLRESLLLFVYYYCFFGKEKRVIFYRFRSDVCFLSSYRARPNLSRPPDDSPPRPAVSVFHTRVESFFFWSPSDSEPMRHKARRRSIQKRDIHL